MSEIMKVVYGDRLSFDVKLILNNQRYGLEYGEKIWFDVYTKSYDPNVTPDVLIHIEQESTMIRIPEITLDPGDYNFDIGIIFSDGTTKTILPCLRNQNNILRVIGKSCINKDNISGSIFEDAFDAHIRESNCSCEDINRIYNIIAQLDRKSFIVVDDLLDRDSIPKDRLVNGKIVKVNDDGTGKPIYFSWDSDNYKFVKEKFNVNVEDINGLDNIISWQEI